MNAPFRYVFAHRGGRAHGPDNTIETFRAALARGAVGLETDAWLTIDGHVVLDHDGVLRAARKRKQPIAQVRRDDLPAHIPTLDELYASCGSDYYLAIDVRLPEVATAVIDVSRSYDALDRLWLVGATPTLLHSWQHLDHSGHYAMSIRVVERRGDIISTARHAGADALNMRWPWWTKRWVRRAHEAGLLAFAYDVQWHWARERCARLGLDAVFTDHVP